MSSIQQFFSTGWVRLKQRIRPEPVETPEPVIEQSVDQQAIENATGYRQLLPDDAAGLLDGLFFCKVSNQDDLVGVFSKMFLFDGAPPEEDYSGIVMVAVVRLPLAGYMLLDDVANRKQYSGEVIYKAKYEKDESVSFRGVLEASDLTRLCQSINDVNYWHALDETRKTILKNTTRPCVKS